MNCKHEDKPWEYRGFANGEEEWLCECGEIVLIYLDCSGGG